MVYKGGRERYTFLPWERTKLDIAYASRKSLTLTEILGDTLDSMNKEAAHRDCLD